MQGAYLVRSLSVFFMASAQVGRHGHSDAHCLKGASIATMVSQGETLMFASLLFSLAFRAE
ncbi:hypothetical protein BCU59_02200 [Vibrio cyclitrophicus]|nr:hypothetical protein BCU59_02200 [Vibrio cyclitrophicus]